MEEQGNLLIQWSAMCWALQSLVLFDPVWRPDSNNIAWLFNGRFIEACWARLAHCGTTFCNQGFLVWWDCRVIYRERILQPLGCTLYSSLIIVISLQLRGHRQIAEPRKYCLVRVIVFLWPVFSLIFVSHGLGIRFNSLQTSTKQ